MEVNFKKLNVTYKKTLIHPKADADKQFLFRQSYKELGLPICYLDESGHAFDILRAHGYSLRETRYYGKHDWGS